MIRMERGENRLNKEFVQAMNQALDAADRYVSLCIYVWLHPPRYCNCVDVQEETVNNVISENNIGSYCTF